MLLTAAMMASAISHIIKSQPAVSFALEDLLTVVPAKPDMILLREYEALKKMIRIGQKGDIPRARVGLSSLELEDKVLVWIDAQGLSEGVRESYGEAANDAVNAWNFWLKRETFFWCLNEAEANIKIRFVESFNEPGDDVLGRVNFNRKLIMDDVPARYELAGQIQVLKVFRGKILPRLEIQEVITHEIGHLVGLDDHDAPTGIMGRFQPGNPRVNISYGELESLETYRETIRAIKKFFAQKASR
jgi:hypothetical protein